MLVTLLGRITLRNATQESNAESPIVVALVEIVMLVSLLQDANATVPDLGDGVGTM